MWVLGPSLKKLSNSISHLYKTNWKECLMMLEVHVHWEQWALDLWLRSILDHPFQPPQQWHQVRPTWMLQTTSLSRWLHPKPQKGGESPGRTLTQFFFIFLRNLFWGNNLSFTIKLIQRYRNFPYTSCPHPCFASLLFSHQHLNTTPQSGIFFNQGWMPQTQNLP